MTERQPIHQGAIHQEADILAAQFPGRDFARPRRVGQGAVSTVYRADVNGEAFAINLHPAGRERVFEYGREEYERERRWTARASAAGVPCPRVLAAGWRGDFAYSVQTFIEGVSGLEASADPSALWEELGWLGRRINAIPVEDADANWRAYVGSVLAGLTEGDE